MYTKGVLDYRFAQSTDVNAIVALIQTHGESKVLAEPKQAILALVEARLMIVCVDVCVDGDNRRVPRSSPLARLYCTKSKN